MNTPKEEDDRERELRIIHNMIAILNDDIKLLQENIKPLWNRIKILETAQRTNKKDLLTKFVSKLFVKKRRTRGKGKNARSKD